MKNLFERRRIEMSGLDLVQFRAFQVLQMLGGLSLIILIIALTLRGIAGQWSTLWPF